MICSSLSFWTSTYTLGWDVGMQFCYTSYFMAGYSLRKKLKRVKNNTWAIVLILSGFTIEMVLGIFRYIGMINGYVDLGQPFDPLAYECLDPIIVVSAILIFSGFSILDIHKSFIKLASDTFLIYLFHVGVWEIVFIVIAKFLPNLQKHTYLIFICTVSVFLISWLLAKIYKAIWNVVGGRITDFVLKCFDSVCSWCV